VQSNFKINLADKVVLVTGAASGIGCAIATRLAHLGASVCLVDIQEALLEQASTEMSGQVSTVIADLSSPESIASMQEVVARKFGRVDILVNNAGLQHVAPLESFAVEKWDEMMHVMLRAAFLNTQSVIPAMVKNGWGRIINIASIHSLVASPFKSAYVTAKHGLVGLTKTAALEVASKGVTVNAISPSYVRTPLVEKQIEKLSEIHQIPPDQVVKEIMLLPMPQNELIEPEEIAQMVIFLCSDAARHINGHNLVVDGGWTIR
jgi:3-hydroxybutyrate dehydrogenase